MSILRDNINSGPKALTELLKNDFIVAPGVFNGISAIQAERAGFNSIYLSGSGVAGSMGLPDLSVTTLTEVADEVRKITAVSKLPLIVDADTGFGEPINVTRTIRILEAAGAAALHLEDQVLPKKCGHLNGKKIVDRDEMNRKIRSATEARKNNDFIIIARTDARSVLGIDDAIDRANSYLESGADIIFTEAMESIDEFRKCVREIHGPLLANMTEFGKSPLLSTKELRDLGYRAVIFPLTAFRVTLKAVQSTYDDLYKSGTQRDFIDRLMPRSEYYDVIGYHEYEDEDLNLYNFKKGGK
jgi:methylisocitrate lyase